MSIGGLEWIILCFFIFLVLFILHFKAKDEYVSFALSTFARVENGTFARKIIHLFGDFRHICQKHGTFVRVKKAH